MKNILVVFIFLLTFFSCTPRDGLSLYQTGTVEIYAQVVNPRTNISLGDSFAFYFEVPDTVLLNGNRIKVTAGVGDGGNIGFDAQKIIPSLPGGFSNNPSLNTCKLWASPGSLTSNETFVLANQSGKLLGKFYIIPQQRGTYFFHQRQEGYIDLNNESLKLRFNFNFGSINRNHQMLIDSAGAANNFNLFLQDQISRGLEVYGFRVN